jgi:hypothetical protein
MLRSELTIEVLKTSLDNILAMDSFEEQKIGFQNLKKNYPFIREEDPYKTLYWDAVKRLVKEKDLPVNGPNNFLNQIDPHHADNFDREHEVDTSTFDSYNPRIKNFGLFLESVSAAGGVQKEVKKIISEMFAYGKNIKFSGDQNGEPQYVEFEVDKNDFKMDYDQDLFMEYSENVLKKRKYKVALKYRSKKNTGTEEKPVYTMKFKINLKSTEGVTSEPKKEEMLAWGFEDKPTKVLNFIKGEKQKCKWDSSSNVLSMTKSAFDKCATEQLRNIIRDSGGEKVRI